MANKYRFDLPKDNRDLTNQLNRVLGIVETDVTNASKKTPFDPTGLQKQIDAINNQLGIPDSTGTVPPTGGGGAQGGGGSGSGGFYAINLSFIGSPLSSDEICFITFSEALVFAAGFPKAVFQVRIAPTANYTVTMNTQPLGVGAFVPFGTATVLAGQTAGTFSVAAQVSVAATDNWQFVGQVGSDLTLTDLAFDIQGTRS